MATKTTTKTADTPFAALFEDLPFDMKAWNDSLRATAALGEKFSKLALEAAERNIEISSKWAHETLAQLADVAKLPEDPAEAQKALTAFTSNAVEAASENVAALAEVAKKVQIDSVELMLAAGREVQAETAEAVKKATTEAAEAMKKATAKAAPKAAKAA